MPTHEGARMRISEREHTFESFINELVLTGMEPKEPLRIVCYVTHEGSWKEESKAFTSLNDILVSNGVEIRELGEIKQLVMHYRNIKTDSLVTITFFAFLHRDTGLLICFTNAAKYDVEQTLDKIVERTPGLYFAYISPPTLRKLENMIFEKHPTALITLFTAYRHQQSFLRCEIRPEYKRTIEYRGRDGARVLEELRDSYGILPRSIHFEIPSFAVYQIHNSGHLTITRGDETARRYMLEIVDFTMKDTLLTRKIVESADFKLVPIETQRKTYLFPKLRPWIIKFSSPIDIEEGRDLVSILLDNKFEVFNHVLIKGSLRFNGFVADRIKNSIFTIDSNTERMVIAPLREVPFDSFLRFYQAIVDNFDPNAVCEVFE